MKHFQDIIFIRIRTYREIFKSALVYLYKDVRKRVNNVWESESKVKHPRWNFQLREYL